MKKRDLSRLALLGIASGLITLCQNSANASEKIASNHIDLNLLLAEHKCNGPHGCPGDSKNSTKPPSNGSTNSTKTNSNKPLPSNKTSSELAEREKDDGNLGYHVMTEDELLLELNDQGTALYNSLDAEGKALARLVASQRCQDTNECKGLNACQTDKNTCAGKGECKGKGKCAFSDKNMAVKVVADKMAKKRAEANKGNSK